MHEQPYASFWWLILFSRSVIWSHSFHLQKMALGQLPPLNTIHCLHFPRLQIKYLPYSKKYLIHSLKCSFIRLDFENHLDIDGDHTLHNIKFLKHSWLRYYLLRTRIFCICCTFSINFDKDLQQLRLKDRYKLPNLNSFRRAQKSQSIYMLIKELNGLFLVLFGFSQNYDYGMVINGSFGTFDSS